MTIKECLFTHKEEPSHEHMLIISARQYYYCAHNIMEVVTKQINITLSKIMTISSLEIILLYFHSAEFSICSTKQFIKNLHH